MKTKKQLREAMVGQLKNARLNAELLAAVLAEVKPGNAKLKNQMPLLRAFAECVGKSLHEFNAYHNALFTVK